MSPSIIILTGPPGSGKTAIGELMASKAPHNSVHMRVDNFFTWVRAGFIPPDQPESRAQNATVLTAAAMAAITYWRGGYEVIIDGIVGPWFLPILQTAFAKANAPTSYVIVRADEKIAIDRCLFRDRAEAVREMEGIRGLHSAFANVGNLEPHVVNTSSISAAEAARQIREALPGGRFLITAPKS